MTFGDELHDGLFARREHLSFTCCTKRPQQELLDNRAVIRPTLTNCSNGLHKNVVGLTLQHIAKRTSPECFLVSSLSFSVNISTLV
jgi:hypothetical protein